MHGRGVKKDRCRVRVECFRMSERNCSVSDEEIMAVCELIIAEGKVVS